MTHSSVCPKSRVIGLRPTVDNHMKNIKESVNRTSRTNSSVVRGKATLRLGRERAVYLEFESTNGRSLQASGEVRSAF